MKSITNRSKILALDFDGVLFDTSFEKLFTGFNAYRLVNPNTELFGGKRLSFENYNYIRSHYTELVDRFNILIDFIGAAGENACIFELLETQGMIRQEREYRQFIKNIDYDIYKKYHHTMLMLRDEYETQNNNEYIKLIKPNHEIIEPLRELHENIFVFICSMKPKNNIEYILSSHGVSHLFNDTISILSSQVKIQLLEEYARKLTIDEKQVYFIDDHPHHLSTAVDSNMNCFFAEWGYHRRENTFENVLDPEIVLSISGYKSLLNKINEENQFRGD
jgi:phosphoglycolate phosphatase-like HAD superfamily hydrolase